MTNEADISLISKIAKIDEATSAIELFNILKDVVTVYHIDGFRHRFQTIFFPLLEKRDFLNPVSDILNTLIREIGLFPYIDEDIISTFKDKLTINAFTSPKIREQKTVFHYPQARVFHTLISGKSVILSAPTSFGKSLIIDSIIAANKFKNIVIVVPTLALIDETRKRIAKLHLDYKIVTHKSQNKSNKNIYVLTQERVVIGDFIEEIDFFVIDEFYKLSPLQAQKDDSRCDTLNLAFYKLFKRCSHFYMLGPNIDGVAKSIDESVSYEFIKEEFPTVGSNIIKLNTKPTAENIYSIYNANKKSTLIYCNTPKTATETAIEISSFLPKKENIEIIESICSWLADTYHGDWAIIRCLKHGIALHHARMPRALSQLFVELFNKGLIDIIVCTSTIIEGVNTSAKNVIMKEQRRGNTRLDFFTFNNVAGRAGRMFKHFIGNVFIFSDAPQPFLPIVDIPVLTQGKDTSINILLGMDRNDLSEDSYEKVSTFYEKDNKILSVEIIKKHHTIAPEKQLSLAKNIKKNRNAWHKFLLWKQMPNWEQLEFLCGIMFRYFNAKNLVTRSISSPKQLAFLINRLKKKNPISSTIADDFSYHLSKGTPVAVDSIIAETLDFNRMWAQYHFPRLTMVISDIQKEILEKLGLECGDYSFFASAVEGLFYDPALVCLEEYGIPFEISRKIEKDLAKKGDLDATLNALRRMDTKSIRLSTAEKSFIEKAKESI